MEISESSLRARHNLCRSRDTLGHPWRKSGPTRNPAAQSRWTREALRFDEGLLCYGAVTVRAIRRVRHDELAGAGLLQDIRNDPFENDIRLIGPAVFATRDPANRVANDLAIHG